MVREPEKVRRVIGLAGQHAAVDDDLTGRENLLILGLMQHIGPRGPTRPEQSRPRGHKARAVTPVGATRPE